MNDIDMSELDKILSETQEELSETNPDKLKSVSKLCTTMQKLESLKADVEEQLSRLGKTIHLLSTEDIPAAMDEAGLVELTLESGHKVKIVPFFTARLPKEAADVERHDLAVAWLEDNGYDGFIKNVVTASFDKSESEAASELMELIIQAGFTPTKTSDVHWASMDKIFKTTAEAGDNFPLELFSAFNGRKTKIKG